MPDRPSMPPDSPLSGGQITRVSVTYTIPTEKGRWHSIIGLKMMREHARPGRVQDLVYDLAVICEEVIATRPARAEVSVLPSNVARLPSQPPPPRSEAYHILLAVVCDALDCPPPADPSGEEVFLRLRSERARLVLTGLRPLLADQQADPAQMTDAVRRLQDGVAASPADGYAHSPLSC
jgi:hypothetical protein